jgi:hypothetical protein
LGCGHLPHHCRSSPRKKSSKTSPSVDPWYMRSSRMPSCVYARRICGEAFPFALGLSQRATSLSCEGLPFYRSLTRLCTLDGKKRTLSNHANIRLSGPHSALSFCAISSPWAHCSQYVKHSFYYYFYIFSNILKRKNHM